MFSLQWNIENIVAPLVIGVVVTIFSEFFVQYVEHIKKLNFLLTFALCVLKYPS